MEEKKDFLERHLGLNKDQRSDLLGKLFGIAVVGFLIWVFFLKPLIGRFWGVPEIGHVFEKNRPYDTTYYVNLFPENADAKNYRLKGNITVDSICEGSDEDTECFTTINLNYVRWPNSGRSYFDDCNLASGNKELCIDDQDRNWEIELTHERVK